jgi:hypothetical protein
LIVNPYLIPISLSPPGRGKGEPCFLGPSHFRGHPIIPLSRKKLFKEKSIDRKPAFFG